MKRAMSVALLVAAFAAGSGAQARSSLLDDQLSYLTEDLTAIVGSIGSDIAPQLLSTALAGDIVGEAAFKGDFPHGCFILPAVGISLGQGFATALNSDSGYDWKFELLSIPSLIDTTIAGMNNSTVSDIYAASRKIFPYPSAAVGFGFGLSRDWEFLVNGFFIPQQITDNLLAMVSSSTVSALSPTFSTASVEFKIRKVFFRDTRSYPAMSLALGGVYSQLSLGASVDLAELLGKEIELSGTTLNLASTEPISFSTMVYGAGLEFAVSKRLPLITPFARAGLWYRHAVVSTSMNLDATIITTEDGVTKTATTKIAISPTATDDAIDARLGAGLELRFFAILFHLSANLDLESPLVEISSLSLTGISTNGLSINTGIRWAF
jgi:hypothetical protein